MGEFFAPLFFLLFLISASESYRFMGCYKENAIEARLMNGDQREFRGTLTPDKCITFCKSNGFSYAGLQYGYECFCSQDRPSIKSFTDLSDCSTKCEGDKTKLCGGPLRLSVYDIENKRVNYVQANYVGCYADDGENRRALRGKVLTNGTEMTPEFCVGFCFNHGYRFAGVQYSKQCFCGDEIKGESSSEGECDKDCAGDSRLLCGGNWRSGIYRTSISDESEDGRLLGCFVDSETRLLSGHFRHLKETNSPRRCLNVCLQLGFKFAGVEAEDECHCGNRRPDSSKETRENECLAQCPNSRKRACGGSWRLAVYSTSPALTQIPQPVIIVPGTGNHVTDIIAQPTTSSGGGQILTLGQPPVRPQTTTTTTTRTATRRPPAVRTTTERWSSGVTNSQSCPQSRTEHGGRSICEGELIFHEKFNSWDGNWKHEIFMPDGPDYEFVVFDDNRENIFLESGKLHIKPSIFEDNFVRRGRIRLEKCTGKSFTEECERESRAFAILPPVRSARITTKESFSFKYGKIVINARLPAGDWIIPEIWLEPKDHVYGPGYQSGRIRIAHSVGNRDLTYNGEDRGARRLEQGLLMGTSENKIRGRKRIKPNERRPWFDDFHNFTLTWTPENIFFQVDNEEKDSLIPFNSGKLYKLVGFDNLSADQWEKGSSIAPFDQQFYISVGVSVGGMREFIDDCVTGRDHPKPWTNFAVKGMMNFWNDRVNWFPTWNNNKFGLEIADIFVYAL